MDLSAYVTYYPGATDIHLTEGMPVVVRVCGRLTVMSHIMEKSMFDQLIQDTLSKAKIYEFEERGSVDTSFSGKNIRYRLHIYRTGGRRAAAIRILPGVAHLPEDPDKSWIEHTAHLSSGLVLVTGTTGSGKTTTMARLISEMNYHQALHIVTLEDPIEYIFPPKKALIHQREKGMDFCTFPEGIRAALREDPDVIVIGEMRDRETIEAALTAAETGHLVIATLHNRRAVDAIGRIVHAFPEGEQGEVRSLLSRVLRTVSAQVLYEGLDHMVLIREILLMTPAISHLIRDGKDEQIRSYMELAKGDMRTMEQAAGLISRNWEEGEKKRLMEAIG
jgi:twitching motility protein PilT